MSSTSNERVERFREDVASLHLSVGSADRERRWQILGALLMAVGVVIAFAAYFGSTSLSDPRDVQSQTTLAIAGLALTVAGGLVFLRYSLSRFMRVWLLRQIHEGRAQLDQALGRTPTAAAEAQRGGGSTP